MPPVALGDAWSALRRQGRVATREIAVLTASVLLLGAGALQVSPPPAEPDTAPAAVAAPAPSTSPPAPAGSPFGNAGRTVDLTSPKAPSPAAPRPAAAPARPAAPAPARWLPTGGGMWLHDWNRSEGGNPGRVVSRARGAGLTHLYVQTGSSRKGFIGEEVLSELLPVTRGTDVKVIAWDFPKLDDPLGDARRLGLAARWSRPGVPRIAAVAPDVETAAEGAKATPERVRQYYRELRRVLPADMAILATVPWPSEKRTGSYPYTETAPHADAFIPMAYWYNRSPVAVTKTSMQWLKRFGKPVMPVGQGYDGRLDAPYLKADPHPDKSVAAFMVVARQQGARSFSLWSWQTTGRPQWHVLARHSLEVKRLAAAARPKPVLAPTPAPARPAAPPAAPPAPAASPAPSPSTASRPAGGAKPAPPARPSR